MAMLINLLIWGLVLFSLFTGGTGGLGGLLSGLLGASV